MQNMTSNQPYLLKAFYDWIIDNGLTPYMVIDANTQDVEVPQDFVRDGQIVLNVSPSACANFFMDIDQVSFQARFSGQPMVVRFPCRAVTAIYAKENGAGTVFTPELLAQADESDEQAKSGSEEAKKTAKASSKKASLRVVK
ncbi:ClpXP protease specificity-enhancing factor [Glaciecola siphonariae]|uniref:ClpXP protease specificity-enhancing factor n=1 Tax=Glaciecola siphonariae TaxID=521012 RepID=A0ABV9LZA5_9ALTE